jgi:hypothetical protein
VVPLMDPELKAALEELRGAAGKTSDRLGAIESSIAQNRDLSLENHERMRRELAMLSGRQEVFADQLNELRKLTFGSKPPPPAPIARMASQADDRSHTTALDLAALEGRMIQGFAEVGGELRRQSTAMGLGLRGLAWLRTERGRETVVRLASLAGVAYVAFRSATAAPPPPPPPPPPIVVVPDAGAR